MLLGNVQSTCDRSFTCSVLDPCSSWLAIYRYHCINPSAHSAFAVPLLLSGRRPFFHAHLFRKGGSVDCKPHCAPPYDRVGAVRPVFCSIRDSLSVAICILIPPLINPIQSNPNQTVRIQCPDDFSTQVTHSLTSAFYTISLLHDKCCTVRCRKRR